LQFRDQSHKSADVWHIVITNYWSPFSGTPIDPSMKCHRLTK